uniref:Uncharacterized protein n=1 Tax=Mycena chlorophos TaxID=658473 RepID=A0ABQ0M0N7_MYCCL|nr:predicted protein [Mycena chlorophos]
MSSYYRVFDNLTTLSIKISGAEDVNFGLQITRFRDQTSKLTKVELIGILIDYLPWLQLTELRLVNCRCPVDQIIQALDFCIALVKLDLTLPAYDVATYLRHEPRPLPSLRLLETLRVALALPDNPPRAVFAQDDMVVFLDLLANKLPKLHSLSFEHDGQDNDSIRTPMLQVLANSVPSVTKFTLQGVNFEGTQLDELRASAPPAPTKAELRAEKAAKIQKWMDERLGRFGDTPVVVPPSRGRRANRARGTRGRARGGTGARASNGRGRKAAISDEDSEEEAEFTGSDGSESESAVAASAPASDTESSTSSKDEGKLEFGSSHARVGIHTADFFDEEEQSPTPAIPDPAPVAPAPSTTRVTRSKTEAATAAIGSGGRAGGSVEEPAPATIEQPRAAGCSGAPG